MHDTARLSEYAEAIIDGFLADGIQLTPVEIITINALAWEVASPSSREMLARGIPVEVGGAILWPQTLRASEWYGRVGVAMQPRWLATVALGYSMAHGYSEATELDAVGVKAALAVFAWYMRLRCRTAQFTLAMADVLAQEEESEQPPDESLPQIGIGDLSASLSAASGISADFWERRCSQGYAFASLTALAQHAHADDRPLDSDPTIRAERALGWYEEKLRNKYAKEGKT